MNTKRKKTGGAYRPYRDVVAAHPANAAKAAPEFTWDDLGQIAVAFNQKLSVAAMSRDLFNDVAAVSRIPNIDELRNIQNIIDADIVTYRNRLGEIAQHHSGRSGKMTNPDEMFACIDLSERYLALDSSFDQVVMVNVFHLQQEFTKAVTAPAQNPAANEA